MEIEFIDRLKQYRRQFGYSALGLIICMALTGMTGISILFGLVVVVFVISASLFGRWAFIKCPKCGGYFYNFMFAPSLLSTRGFICHNCHHKFG